MKEKILKLLTKVNKPSRYIGQEVGSFNKDWDSAEIRIALAFPDLYEIGISNLGLRILYDKINNYQLRHPELDSGSHSHNCAMLKVAKLPDKNKIQEFTTYSCAFGTLA